jgi:uncharacterized membrane protein
MTWLIVGLVLFLGAHATRIFGENWRTQTLATWGEKPFKGVIALVSLLGFYGLVVGYAEVRLQPLVIWQPPLATRHVSVLLMLLASILLVAAYIPANHVKARLGHPMVLSIKVWALAHLLANGNLADLLLFGSFLAWSVLNFKSARARDRDRALADGQAQLSDASAPSPPPKTSATLLAVGVGAVLWALITFVWHAQVVGVSPLG